ncbi:hypothetical protein AAVH_34939 [Aphelenchoides avenae]|nr:hypothetical protein AAVH_34939 [Aphelenchus avenae]
MVSGEPYSKLAEYLRLHYDEGSQRFTLKLNTAQIETVDVSHQLAYMLGFEGTTFAVDRTEAKYMPDLHGGIHSLYIHAPKLVEPSIVGDTWAPLLRIAKVKGGPGDFVEDVFLTPQYHKVLEKQVSEISVQIRVMHVIFNPDAIDWHGHLSTQWGGAAYFEGFPYQRGAGIGSIFGGLFRFLLPMLKTAGKEIGREGLSVGARVLGDLAQGKNLRHSVINETSEGLRNLVERTNPTEKLRNAVEESRERLLRGGGGVRRRRPTAPAKKRPVSTPTKRSSVRSAKRKRLDYLDYI